jgi:Ca-activated chloride channel family protein
MAEALGWPKAQIGWSDVLSLATNPQGWASKGHPEWGKFVLGKTNPNLSTSGLAATIGAFVAATGTSSDLKASDLKDPKIRSFVSGVESSVVHYGDTTLTYLQNLQRADDAGAALGYVSAVAVEEKSVLDYDAGNPSGDPKTLGQHANPKVPLVAVYPKEGTLYSDSPYAILKAPWSTADKQAGAKDFLDYLREPAQQKLFTDANFRTYDNKPGDPVKNSKSVIADGVKITLTPPNPEVLAGVRSTWEQLRKPARILLVLDVSGSMGDPAGSSGSTKLELAQAAAVRALDQLAPRDQVGLWEFTTKLNATPNYRKELVPIDALSQNKANIVRNIKALIPLSGTPLYAAIRSASDYLTQNSDEKAINAVVVLTDGRNEYPEDDNVDSLVSQLQARANEGGVRVFSIAYGADADLGVLKRISEASRAAAYDATNPASIDAVFTNVLSNF